MIKESFKEFQVSLFTDLNCFHSLLHIELHFWLYRVKLLVKVELISEDLVCHGSQMNPGRGIFEDQLNSVRAFDIVETNFSLGLPTSTVV